jgi:hypothetical protein
MRHLYRMPQLSTLEQIANIVIKRTIEETGDDGALMEALERAYPFPGYSYCREIWERALEEHNIRREYSQRFEQCT